MTSIYQGSSGINAKEYNLLINITNTAVNMLDYSEAAQLGRYIMINDVVDKKKDSTDSLQISKVTD